MSTFLICEHLKPLLNSLLQNGAKIESADIGWSEAKIAVVLDRGLNPNVAALEAKRHGVEFWRNNDPHYDIEYGYFCNEHKHGISWPQKKSTIHVL